MEHFGVNLEGPCELMPFEPTLMLACYRVDGQILQWGKSRLSVKGVTILPEAGDSETFLLWVGEVQLPWLQEEPVEEGDKAFILSEVEGTREHMAEIDALIEQSAKGWDPERMNKVDLAILRLAIYEMKWGETPVGVAINEAVELAKKFGQTDSPGFVNGVLAKFAN